MWAPHIYRGSFNFLSNPASVDHYGVYLASFVQFLLNIAARSKANVTQPSGTKAGGIPTEVCAPIPIDAEEASFWDQAPELYDDGEEGEGEGEGEGEDEYEDESEDEYAPGGEEEGHEQDNGWGKLQVTLTDEQILAAQVLQRALEGNDLNASINAFHGAVLSLATTQNKDAETNRFGNITDAFLVAKNIHGDGSIRATVSVTPGFSMIQYSQLFAILKQALLEQESGISDSVLQYVSFLSWPCWIISYAPLDLWNATLNGLIHRWYLHLQPSGFIRAWHGRK